MRKSSKKQLARKTPQINRPFKPAVLEKARRLAAQYGLLLQPDPDSGFIGTALEWPECVGTGKTALQCVRNTREILVSAIATTLEMGKTPPRPSAPHLRGKWIKIRLTSEEKLLLKETAQSSGFRGISDFIRSTTLAAVR